MIFGLYRHYKGGLYLGLWRVWESTNGEVRRDKVLYFSFKERKFNVRDAIEFHGSVYEESKARKEWDYTGNFRFMKLGIRVPCYCREISDTMECPKHGTPSIGHHMQLKRFDGHEHERKLK